MTRYKYTGKATGQKSQVEYNRRKSLVKSGKASWWVPWCIGTEEACKKAGLI
jgi:hypothetical protein